MVRVVIAEDSALLREALARVLRDGGVTEVETIRDARALQHADDSLDRLTPRERDVLALMAEGRSNAGIAAALVLSDSAVAKHITNIFTKLDIPPAGNDNRRVLAVLRFLRAG